MSLGRDENQRLLGRGLSWGSDVVSYLDTHVSLCGESNPLEVIVGPFILIKHELELRMVPALTDLKDCVEVLEHMNASLPHVVCLVIILRDSKLCLF